MRGLFLPASKHFWSVVAVLMVVSMHVTVRDCEPVPHVLLQLPQLADLKLYAGQALWVQTWMVAGLLPAHAESALIVPFASESVSNVLRHFTTRVSVPEAQVTLHALNVSVTQTIFVGTGHAVVLHDPVIGGLVSVHAESAEVVPVLSLQRTVRVLVPPPQVLLHPLYAPLFQLYAAQAFVLQFTSTAGVPVDSPMATLPLLPIAVPSAWDTKRVGMVILASTPPSVKMGVPSLLARITAMAPNHCAVMTLLTYEQPPRLMRATLPATLSG